MSRQTLVVVAFAAVVLIAAGAAFLLLRDSGEEDYSLGVMSTRGRPFEMPVPEQLFTPGSPKTTGEAFLIAEREGIRLVRLPREDGSSCWGTSERRSGEWQLTNFVCETQFNRFPDPTGPVLVLSRGGFIPGTQFRTYESFHGLAADGVARVGVVDGQERLVPMATVRGNAFYGEAPADRIKAIVALDENGEVIWRSAPVPLPDE
ncbi:MAG TPA: hypothetical protein VGW30_07620 [Gaiellaceae bacterium]|nr:hypothetical protein [Gaiellaceae bacterium]